MATGADLLATVASEQLPIAVVVEDVLAEPSWDTSTATMLGRARRVRIRGGVEMIAAPPARPPLSEGEPETDVDNVRPTLVPHAHWDGARSTRPQGQRQ